MKLQLNLFEVMANEAVSGLNAKRARLESLADEMRNVRAEIRTLQETLTSSRTALSADAVAQRIRLQDRLDRLIAADERFLQLLAALDALAARARKTTGELRSLPTDRLSEEDKAKLQTLGTSFVEQLHEYHFGSFSDADLRIGDDDYLPRRDDFDLQADISASDAIRVIWAYLLGLLDVAQRHGTNHPRVILFDEPRQQSANPVSFGALLKRAATSYRDAQILFVTSEELASLEPMLQDVPHDLITVDGYLLQALAE